MAGIKKNRDILTGGKRYIQQKAKKHLVEEVTFDKESRKEYLTGFHKRKVQRQKKAQEYHKEQDRLFKIEERKRIRDERKKDAEVELQKFNDSIKNVKNFKGFKNSENGEDEIIDELNEIGELESDNNDDWTEDVRIRIKEDGEWRGFSETPNNDSDNDSESDSDSDEEDDQEVDEKPIKGILHHTEVYKQDPSINSTISNGVIIDDETTVTVESLENPNLTNLETVAKQNNVNLEKADEILEKSIQRAKNYAVLCGVSKPKPKSGPKKKFRYLSKSERKDNLRKEKSTAKRRGKK